MDRGAWQATVCGGKKESDVTEQLTLHFTDSSTLRPAGGGRGCFYPRTRGVKGGGSDRVWRDSCVEACLTGAVNFDGGAQAAKGN